MQIIIVLGGRNSNFSMFLFCGCSIFSYGEDSFDNLVFNEIRNRFNRTFLHFIYVDNCVTWLNGNRRCIVYSNKCHLITI